MEAAMEMYVEGDDKPRPALYEIVAIDQNPGSPTNNLTYRPFDPNI